MGLFLGVSGVIGADSPTVLESLRKYAQAKGMRFEPESEGLPGDPGVGVIATEGGNTSVLYPDEPLTWEAASSVSEDLGRPVFALQIYDGDFWTYTLYNNGQVVDEFNPMPEYWGDVSPEEKERYAGNAEVVARTVGVGVETIANYLVEWDLDDDSEAKAYPDDECPIGDCWQMTDFMSKVGLPYPMDEQGDLQGTAFVIDAGPQVPTKSQARSTGKPWWKFW